MVSTMLSEKVFEHFGTQAETARRLKITRAAVAKWGEMVPELRAVQLHRLTRGRLRYRPEDYEKSEEGCA